jgi:hypothetical protein
MMFSIAWQLLSEQFGTKTVRQSSGKRSAERVSTQLLRV